MANMDNNLPMDKPPLKPHDIVLHGQIMPTPAKTWSMHLRRQKPMADVDWASRIPLKHYGRNAWVPWLWGQVRWLRIGAPIGTTLHSVHFLRTTPRLLSPNVLSFLPHWAEFWDMWLSCLSDWTAHARGWLSPASTHGKWICAKLLVLLSLVDSFPQRGCQLGCQK